MFEPAETISVAIQSPLKVLCFDLQKDYKRESESSKSHILKFVMKANGDKDLHNVESLGVMKLKAHTITRKKTEEILSLGVCEQEKKK